MCAQVQGGSFMAGFTFRGLVTLVAIACLVPAAALAQEMRSTQDTGSGFQCDDGSRLMLEFDVTGSGLDALVSLRGATFRLPYVAPEPGLAQIVWSDGERSLTWLPGVRLMWMASETHLMCGRGGHKH
jgi:hypothetical protein